MKMEIMETVTRKLCPQCFGSIIRPVKDDEYCDYCKRVFSRGGKMRRGFRPDPFFTVDMKIEG